MSLYGLLADVVVVAHATFVGIVVFGLLAILAGAGLGWGWVRGFWFRLIHLGMIALVVTESLLNVPCPLTVLEDALRRMAGESVAEGTFVGRCVHDMIFYDAPPWVFTVAYCVFGAIVVGTMVLLPPHWPTRRAPSH